MIRCAYCRGEHATQDELEACGDHFWNTVDLDAEREREIDAYRAHQSEVERESFDESR